jgi:hypothetical protein
MTPQAITLNFPLNFAILLKLNSEVLFGKREELLLRAYVPGIKIKKESIKRDGKPDLIIDYRFSKEQKILYKKKGIVIMDNWSAGVPVYFFHLIYSISHQLLLNKGHYAMHSVCVGKKNQWSLLLGHTGVGKSSSMIKLLSNYGFKLFSSNKTLVNFSSSSRLVASAGTQTVTYKNSDKKNLESLTEQGVGFVDRAACELFGKFLATNKKVKINSVYLIRLNPAVKEFVKLNEIESLVALFPFFFDHINSDIILFGGKDLYNGGTVVADIKKKVLRSLKKSLKYLNVYTLNGSLDFVCKIINEHHEDK